VPRKKARTEEEIQDRVTELFDEVRRQSKAKKKIVKPKDKPKIRKRPASAAKEKRRERKAARGQEVLTGPTVTLKDLAFDHEIAGKELRRLLRRSNIEKPGGRWEWAKDDPAVETIVELIRSSGKGKS